MSANNKPYTVHHWDTFDNETFQLGSFKTLGEAEQFVEDRYQGRIRPTGADKVDIVLQGRIVRQYAVG